MYNTTNHNDYLQAEVGYRLGRTRADIVGAPRPPGARTAEQRGQPGRGRRPDLHHGPRPRRPR